MHKEAQASHIFTYNLLKETETVLFELGDIHGIDK